MEAASPAERSQQTEREPCQQHEQAAEHVQLGVEVDDHLTGVAAALEEPVHGRKRLHRALKRADSERRAAREREPAHGRRCSTEGADDESEQEPEAQQHRCARAHEEEWMESGRLLCLLGCQPSMHEASLVKAEVERHRVERKRSEEQEVEAAVGRPSRGRLPPQERRELEEHACDEHRQTGDEVDVRVGDRIDPLACMACPVEPLGVRRLHLHHALNGPGGQACRSGRDELPQMSARLGNPDEPSLEDREEDGGREAPVADAHHAGAHPDRYAVPVAHVRLGGAVVRAGGDEPSDRDPVADERDVEDEQADGGEPEGALGERLAGERTADDPGERVPAQPGCDQRPAADDHHVRVREIADQVTGVSGASEPLGGPRQVLREHVQAAENEKAAAGDEVLRELLIVRPELFVGVRLRPDRRRLPRYQTPDRS